MRTQRFFNSHLDGSAQFSMGTGVVYSWVCMCYMGTGVVYKGVRRETGSDKLTGVDKTFFMNVKKTHSFTVEQLTVSVMLKKQ